MSEGRELAPVTEEAITKAEAGGALAVADAPRRLLTPQSTGQRPFPRKIAIGFGVGALLGLVGAYAKADAILVPGFFVAILAACGLGAWAEQRIYHGLLGLGAFKRMMATLLAPLFLIVIATPLATLAGVPMAFIGDNGVTCSALALGGLWAGFMAFGTAAMVFIDVVVSALVKDFRSRVQLAVLSLLAIVVSFSVGIIAAGKFIATQIVTNLKTDDLTKHTVNLGDEVLTGEQIRPLLEMSETTDFLALMFLVVGGIFTLPSILSACGKLADGVMERLHPLSQAIEEVTAGKLDLRVEEGGSDDFKRISRGFNRMVQSLEDTLQDLDRRNRDLADLNRATSRFVPFQFLELLDKESIRDIRRGDQIELDITVLFADIRGFTTMAERMGPERTFGFINRYLGHMEAAIHREQGFINDVFGDGIMALFHVNADAGVRAALGMLEALKGFNAILEEEGHEPIHIGIGLNSGPLMLGTIGGQDRLSCTVIGDPANTAARTEGMTKLYGASLLITQGTYERLKDPSAYDIREVDRVQAKGKLTSLSIYEVLDGEPPARRADKNASRDGFGAALEHYREGDFAEAKKAFGALAASAPLDGSATLYLKRAEERLTLGADREWDGVTRLTQK